MKTNDAKFVYTKSTETAEKMKTMGFTEVQSVNGVHVFINDGKMLFDESTDCVYSNILHI